MMARRVAAMGAAGMILLAMGGCQALYFMQGRGDAKAVYELPKDKRVLVFVDSPAGIQLPTGFPESLGERLADHLYKYKAATNIVAQDRLTQLRRDPTFGQMGIQDVAKATNAEVVLYVNMVGFNATPQSGGEISRGDVQAMVKVVDNKGNRLWPVNQPTGTPIDAHVEETLAESRDQTATQKELADILTIRIGRTFHKYSLDDKEMTK